MSTKILDKSGLAYFWSKIKAWCNSLFALDSNVVHKTGNEIIAGTKTFSSIISGSISGNAVTASDAFRLTSSTPDSTWQKVVFTGGQPVIGTLAGNAYVGSSNNVQLISVPEDGTYITQTTANVQNLRFVWNSDHFSDIFVSPNNRYVWHRDVGAAIAYSWRRLVEENAAGIAVPNWNISIAGNAATATAVAWSGVTGKPTTISGYGITDANIANGTITLGSNSITPLTSHQDISGKVDKSGDTMTGDLIITNNNTLNLRYTSITRGTVPSTNAYPFFVKFTDNVNNLLGGLYYEYFTDKSVRTHLMCYQGTTNADTWNSIGIGYDASGNAYTWAPTPATADNSAKIATTAFVKAQGYLTSHQDISGKVNKSGDTMTGDLTITTGSANQIRLLHGNYSILLRNDGWGFWILQTASGDPWGYWNDARPFYINLSNGLCYINGILPDNIPVGSIIYHASGAVPANYLLCNGGAVSRTTYAALFNVIGTTYGAGDGSSTFNVPNLIGRFPEGSATPGTVLNAGLPNITGNLNDFREYVFGGSDGAFDTTSRTVALNSLSIGGPNNRSFTTNFSASRSSSIYGASSTVQPPALTLVPCIRYA